MTIRSLGLMPAFALLAMGVAHAQAPASTGGGGSMAYPDSLPSGQVKIQAPTARDTGNMAYPSSPGGVVVQAPTGRDTGNMAYPSGGSGVGSTATAPMGKMTRAQMAAAPAMRPDVAPTPAQTATARALDGGPSAAPVPYTDFFPPAAPMGKKGMMMHKPMHKAMMHKPMMKKAPAAAATPAPAAPATK